MTFSRLTDTELAQEIARAFQGMYYTKDPATQALWRDRYEQLYDIQAGRPYQPTLFDDDEPTSYYEAIGLDDYDVVGNR
jgi:hypothetical protein